MIDVLVAGRFVGAAVERTASSGKTFVTSKLRAADSDGETQFINIVAFDASVKSALLALADGDGISVSGAMKISTFEARDATTRVSINVVATAVLSAYQVKHKREAIAQAAGPKPNATRASAIGKRHGSHDALTPPAASNVAGLVDDDMEE